MAAQASVESRSGPAPVASWRHTARLASIFVVIGAVGLLLRGHAAGGPSAATPLAVPRSFAYLSLIATEWALLRGVWAGLRAAAVPWRTLMGRRSRTWSDPVGLVSGATLGAGYVLLVLEARRSAGVEASDAGWMLPRGAAEVALWTLLSASAGFCEEVAFRGYFQTQFEALTHHKGAALLMQAILFGAAHAYQGPVAAFAIAGYGAALGGLVLWRKTLVPAIFAHTVTDLALGLCGR